MVAVVDVEEGDVGGIEVVRGRVEVGIEVVRGGGVVEVVGGGGGGAGLKGTQVRPSMAR